jgi:hypothetical protein
MHLTIPRAVTSPSYPTFRSPTSPLRVLRDASPQLPPISISEGPWSEPEEDQLEDGEDEIDSPELAATNLDQKQWTEYAKRTPSTSASGGSSFVYVCLWTYEDGRPPCKYESKKQLVKRHIETTHLGIK